MLEVSNRSSLVTAFHELRPNVFTLHPVLHLRFQYHHNLTNLTTHLSDPTHIGPPADRKRGVS